MTQRDNEFYLRYSTKIHIGSIATKTMKYRAIPIPNLLSTLEKNQLGKFSLSNKITLMQSKKLRLEKMKECMICCIEMNLANSLIGKAQSM